MKNDFIHIAKRMATDSIYDDAVCVGIWNGYEVYEPIFNDDEEHFIGFPQFIIAKNGEIRWTRDDKESMEIMDSFK